MGIKGLHKGLTFCTKKGNLRDYRGRTIAVDSSSWLHRSVYSVSEQYVESMERKALDSHCLKVSSNYIINRCCEMLNKFHIAEIFLVMDGQRCPLKANESADREERRQQNLKEARAFKRKGSRYQAEEKYKMCIKIRDELTHAVMDAVAKRFRNEPRVKLVWSPYEADAQLAKLCLDRKAHAVITEDSDVLVYSAAARISFPVLFKLDRNCGSCDVISMDWLLSPPAVNAANPKSKTALEGLLLNLAFRETKRPGFGVRLFVQGCVFAGCDYAPNNLPGVGLVNAFKMVRDNSFRNDNIRFQKILEALPRKLKKSLDMEEYELTLAKSEAVFYYHVVLHLNGSCKPMVEPRVEKGEHGDGHHVTDHSPFLGRFGDDWAAFLGKSSTSGSEAPVLGQQQRGQRQPIGKLNIPRKSNAEHSFLGTNKLPATRTSAFQPRQQFGRLERNPYAKKRSAQSPGRASDIQQRNPFNQFARKDDVKRPSNDILKYMQPQPDVRAVKRQFAPSDPSCMSNVTASSKIRNSNAMLENVYSHVKKGPTQSHGHGPQSPVAAFDYGELEDECDTAAPRQETMSRHRAGECSSSISLDKDDLLSPHSERNLHSTVAKMYDLTADDSNSVDAGHKTDEHSDNMSDLGESDFSPPDSIVPPASDVQQSFESNKESQNLEEELNCGKTIHSKYFGKSRPRRITLDPSDIATKDGLAPTAQTNESLPEKHATYSAAFSTPSSRSDSFYEEIVESPEDYHRQSRKNHGIPRAQSLSRPAILPKRSTGPLEAAFNKQKRATSHRHPTKKIRVLGSSRKLNRDPSSFFKPIKREATVDVARLGANKQQRKDDLWSDWH